MRVAWCAGPPDRYTGAARPAVARGKGAMPRLLIRCPATGRPVPTHIALHARSFADLAPGFGSGRLACPHCGRDHAWTKARAFLEGTPPPPWVPRPHDAR